jgi:hypothetical protein
MLKGAKKLVKGHATLSRKWQERVPATRHHPPHIEREAGQHSSTRLKKKKQEEKLFGFLIFFLRLTFSLKDEGVGFGRRRKKNKKGFSTHCCGNTSVPVRCRL